MIDKKLAARFAGNPALLERARAALAADEPLWKESIMEPEQDVRDTVEVMGLRADQVRAGAAIIEGRDVRGATLGLFDAFAEEFLIEQEKPR